jgi:crotonobetainyl-CoA:carnitine CoA-transferase CaiB-like acyl-CoA transferase
MPTLHPHPQPQPQAAPLAGVRVLDLTRLLPGPLATQHLADLGADVVKIEDTGHGDYANPAVRALVNRNKRGLCLDLKQPAGRDVMLRLCRTADAVVEGFRPGVMARLGLGYATLAAANPRIVLCSISGWGQTGPLRDLPGHDLNYAAMAGVADQMGGLSNLPVADLLGGTMGAVMGLLAALYDAARSGQGRHVDVSMADGVLAHAVLPLAALNQQGEVPRGGQGALTGGLACYGLYGTSDGRQLAVGALERKFWDALCERIARPDLAPLHRSGNPATEARLRAELQGLFAGQPLAYWVALFEGSQACVSPVLRLDETLAHPHFLARGMAVPGTPRQLGPAVRMTGFDVPAPRPAPTPGQHSDALLAEAGYDSAALAALRASGALA